MEGVLVVVGGASHMLALLGFRRGDWLLCLGSLGL